MTPRQGQSPGDPPTTATPPDQHAHQPFPQLAGALRAQTGPIIDEWRRRTISAMPEMAELTRSEFENRVREILRSIADALESSTPTSMGRLMETAPEHGFQRFLMEYGLAELFAEQRVLRRVIVRAAEDSLGRACSAQEAATLHGLIDVALQQGVLALVQRKNEELRRAAEAELKYLSFMSHDLGNELFVLRANLEALQALMGQAPSARSMRESADALSAALTIVNRTSKGMRALLALERMRKGDAGARNTVANLREVVEPVVRSISGDGGTLHVGRVTKNIEIAIEPGASARADTNLLTILLQNLIGNAVAYARAVVRIAARTRDSDSWEVSVSDDGPGIPEAERERIFEPFRHADTERSPGAEGGGWGAGAGLGLAIAAQAASMIGTRIELESRLGEGSTFSFRVPRADQ